VLVLHAWWGLNDTTRAVCNRLAEEGFTAYAPDLYHGQIADTIDGAQALADDLDHDQAKADVAEALDFLTQQSADTEDGCAVIGFSLGAFLAIDIAITDPERVHSVVLFYGTGPGDYANARASFLGHFAEKDPYEPQDVVDWFEDALQSAGRQVEFNRYPGTGHWFFEPDREEAFNQAAADLAWERTLQFLNRSTSA
jgi:carboxymethylenebutenolidase